MKHLFYLLISILFVGCFNSHEDDYLGKYNLVYAERNEKETGSLEGAFMEFLNDEEMKTNILGDTISCKYSMDNNVLSQNSEPSLAYKINTIANDSLVLEMKINELPFYLIFIKEKIQ